MISTKQCKRFVLMSAIVFVVFAGCESDLVNESPRGLSTSYETGKLSIGEQGGNNSDALAIGSGSRAPVGGIIWGLVTPDGGGTLQLSTSRLVVHPMAVTETTLVSFSIADEVPVGLHHALNKVYDFTPEGLHFLVPSTLYVSFSDAGLGNRDPDDYWLCYYNNTTHRWEEQPTSVDMVNHQFVVTLHHFSRYAFGR